MCKRLQKTIQFERGQTQFLLILAMQFIGFHVLMMIFVDRKVFVKLLSRHGPWMTSAGIRSNVLIHLFRGHFFAHFVAYFMKFDHGDIMFMGCLPILLVRHQGHPMIIEPFRDDGQLFVLFMFLGVPCYKSFTSVIRCAMFIQVWEYSSSI